MRAGDLAVVRGADQRATTMLADALASMEFLVKDENLYAPAPGVAQLLTEGGAECVLATTRHLANCLRNWAQLSRVVMTGRPAERTPSIRGAQADLVAFIEAMDEISRSMAVRLVNAIG